MLEAFARLGGSPSREALRQFVEGNFVRAGKELRIVLPKDFSPNITLLGTLSDPALKAFATDIHSKWKCLLRLVDKSGLCKGCESTMLDLPFPFLVPGGRFREYYYWDTFWILEGVYVSEMCMTARSVVENTLWMASKYGFVPNGSRAYYLNRSQPPMLPMMVSRFMEECGRRLKEPDVFLGRALAVIKQEHAFWMEKRSTRITDAQGAEHRLNHYSAEMNVPRPEAYLHDVRLAAGMPDPLARSLYHDIAATTESGWDFSGRWMEWGPEDCSPRAGEAAERCAPGLNRTIASRVAPVDLNAMLYRDELVIARLSRDLGHEEQARLFEGLAERRAQAIQALMFDAERGIWKDYDFIKGARTTDRPFYITDLCPLWYGPYHNLTHAQIDAILAANAGLLYGYPGGIPVGVAYTGEQWDFPNVWAPTQYLAVRLHLRLFRETGRAQYRQQALEIAQRWITTTYCGHRHYGQVFEKYHATAVGQPGGGGEYCVQEGFGWSNGVILWMLRELGADLRAPSQCPVLPAAGLGAMRDSAWQRDAIGAEQLALVLLWVAAVMVVSTYIVVLLRRL